MFCFELCIPVNVWDAFLFKNSTIMAKVKIKVGGIKINGEHPINWDEVNAKEWVWISKYFIGDVTDLSRRITLMFDLLGISASKRRKFPDDIHEADIMSLLDLGKFLSEEPPNRWFITGIMINFRKHYAPLPNLSGCTFKEFIYADTYFQYFNETKSAEYLWKLASVLYRPHGQRKDDVRVPFDEGTQDTVAKKWKPVNGYIQEAIFMNYYVVRRHIVKNYPNLFPEKNISVEEDDDQESTSSEPIWVTALNALCDGDLVKVREYENSEVHNVLSALDRFITRKH